MGSLAEWPRIIMKNIVNAILALVIAATFSSCQKDEALKSAEKAVDQIINSQVELTEAEAEAKIAELEAQRDIMKKEAELSLLREKANSESGQKDVASKATPPAPASAVPAPAPAPKEKPPANDGPIQQGLEKLKKLLPTEDPNKV